MTGLQDSNSIRAVTVPEGHLIIAQTAWRRVSMAPLSWGHEALAPRHEVRTRPKLSVFLQILTAARHPVASARAGGLSLPDTVL